MAGKLFRCYRLGETVVGYDPKEPEWAHIARTEPFLDIRKAETTSKILYIGVSEIDQAFKEVKAQVWWGDLSLWPGTPREVNRYTASSSSRDEAHVKLYMAQHKALHGWLEARLWQHEFIDGSGVGTYIEALLNQERIIGPDYEEESEGEDPWFPSRIQNHNHEHRIFQLWCVFREAACRLARQIEFPMWLMKDLGYLASQAHPGLIPTRRFQDQTQEEPSNEDDERLHPVLKRFYPVMKRLLGGLPPSTRKWTSSAFKLAYSAGSPPAWAVDVLRRALKHEGDDHLAMKLCAGCARPLPKEVRRGAPSRYCPPCRPIARREKDRVRKRTMRRTQSQGLPSKP